jgi:hypothetical protein
MVESAGTNSEVVMLVFASFNDSSEMQRSAPDSASAGPQHAVSAIAAKGSNDSIGHDVSWIAMRRSRAAMMGAPVRSDQIPSFSGGIVPVYAARVMLSRAFVEADGSGIGRDYSSRKIHYLIFPNEHAHHRVDEPGS